MKWLNVKYISPQNMFLFYFYDIINDIINDIKNTNTIIIDNPKIEPKS